MVLNALKLPGKWPQARLANKYINKNTPVEEWWNLSIAKLLIVQGLDDRISPPENGRTYKEKYGDRINLIEIENAGHHLIQEQPEKISKAIISYIENES